MGSIGSDLNFFQASVKRLSGGISRASPLWRDEKFAELSASVAQIASQSREVMLAGERCYSALNRFNAIAGEKY